jgi:dihydrofolate reductase
MGKLIVQQVTTLDGFADSEDGGASYFGEYTDWEEVDRDMQPWLEKIDRILLGANTYRLFVDYWPTALSAGEMLAPRINAMPKSVISSTLDSAPWGNFDPATVEHGDAVETVRRLTENNTVILWGSLTLMNSLLEAGVVNELQLRVLPVTIASGRPLFTVPFRATLDSVRSIGDLVIQTYLPVGKEPGSI